MLQSIVLYSSRTGNTQKIATRIFAAIPGDSKDMQKIGEYQGKDAELFLSVSGRTGATAVSRRRSC